MSLNKVKKSKDKKSKSKLNTEFSLVNDGQSSDSEQQITVDKVVKNKILRGNNGKNDIVKSRLSLIIDMLNTEDNDIDDKTLRKNVTIAVKHLIEVADML